MKPRITPEQAAQLEHIIADLDALYDDLMGNPSMEPYFMSKLSTARGDVAFVHSATERTQPVKLVVLEGAAL